MADSARDLKPLLMVIDDDEFAQRLALQALDPSRWQVTLAGDAPEALAQLRHLRPDVILTHVRLPGTDGVSLTRRPA